MPYWSFITVTGRYITNYLCKKSTTLHFTRSKCVMSKDIESNDLRLKIEPKKLRRRKKIIQHLRSGMIILSFSGSRKSMTH